jgi:hypothetical protein
MIFSQKPMVANDSKLPCVCFITVFFQERVFLDTRGCCIYLHQKKSIILIS